MVIDDGDLPGTVLRPAKDDAPLVVDADGVAAGPVTLEGLQPVPRRDGKVAESAGTR
jgi:hypothetical protein